MKVLKVSTGENEYRYQLFDDNGEEVKPFHNYLKFRKQRGLSPNTLKVDVFSLKIYSEFLKENNLTYNKIDSQQQSALEILADFRRYLRRPEISGDDLELRKNKSVRSWSTVNLIIKSVLRFYVFLLQTGAVEHTDAFNFLRSPRDKSILFGNDRYQARTQGSDLLLKRHEPSTVKFITREQYEIVLGKCKSSGSKLLLAMMFECGLSAAQTLGFHLDDTDFPNNQIHIVPRENLENGARVYQGAKRVVFFPPYLAKFYRDYLDDERCGYDSEFLFVNLHGANKGKPMKYGLVQNLFSRLSSATGIKITTRMLRHGFFVKVCEDRMVREHVSASTEIKTEVTPEQDAMDLAFMRFLEAEELLSNLG